MRLRTIILLLFLSGFCFSFYGQNASPFEDNNPIESNTLPSEQTMSDLEQSPRRPGLRYGPGGDGGDPNKETPFPVGDADSGIILLLTAVSFIYVIQTKRRRNEN